ncbi:dockerin type I domain-containing protein [Deinococcus psychrotolerans]|uniref:dockerin type I domain-containing protein n=1 Tax=Deinococcus psychrotolerans TaxID=2489213 RepID=UPI001F151417|nr:dockerin type I domain-containing protein [Deinococcus psychrotolerans]
MAAVGLSAAQAAPSFASVALRPEGAALRQEVLSALSALSTPDFPITLDDSAQGGGAVLVLGGSVPFNPDLSSRTLTVNNVRRTELNPKGPLPLSGAVRAEISSLLGLSEFSPQAARRKLSGADINGDGKVDLTDLALLMGNYGKTGGGLSGDLNRDGRVDESDLNLFTEEYSIP